MLKLRKYLIVHIVKALHQKNRLSLYGMKMYSLALLFLVFFAPVQAKHRQVEVVTENWPPYIVQGDKINGIVTHKVRKILKYAELNYEISIYPWARSYHLATTKPNVLIYSIYRNPQREEHFHWFCPLHQSTPINIYKLATNKTNIDSLTDLRTAVVGIMRGDNSHKYLLNNGFKEGINLDVSATEETNVLKLINGKVDAVVQSEESLKYRLAQLNAEHLKFTSGFTLHKGNKAEHCMAFSKGTSVHIVEKVKLGFEKWLKESKSVSVD